MKVNGKEVSVGLEKTPQKRMKSRILRGKNKSFVGRHRWFGILALVYTV